MISLAEARDHALQHTRGDLFQKLYTIGEQILTGDQWEDQTICPVCERGGDTSVLDHVREKLSHFNEVAEASAVLSDDWAASGWSQLDTLERLTIAEGEERKIRLANDRIGSGGIGAEFARSLSEWVSVLAERVDKKIAANQASQEALRKVIPPQLTAVVELVEAARRLQNHLAEYESTASEIAKADAELARVQRVKSFIEAVASSFQTAESEAATRRLTAVEPLCRDMFRSIMFEPVVPALSKRLGSEDLSISLADFFGVQNLSAQALLSESFRNAFAMSVYLAAASLYAGGAKFMVLDNVTSSLDAGHQLHLMMLIKDRFARPGVPNGPQVIVLSHDTMLEKLFNKFSNDAQWYHQCIEGTARTEILPQSGAVTKVRDATITMLNSGRVTDAGPRVRQYLEFKLEEIISRLRIPVPFDVAFSDQKQMPQNLIDAIKDAVALHATAQSLILDAAQIQGINTAVATIVGNYLAHWATGQTQAFSAGSLLGVMQAIDNLAECFRFEHPPGSGQRRWYKSLSRRI